MSAWRIQKFTNGKASPTLDRSGLPLERDATIN